jgi:adenosine deaminase
VTINTDNTLFSHTTTTDELWLAHTRCGVSAENLREVVLNGFRHAFLPHRDKQALLDEVEPLVALPDAT